MKEYLDEKRFKLNYQKTKIMRFQKGRERRKGMNYRWKRKRIEEVKEFTYLRYTLQRNGGQEANVES